MNYGMSWIINPPCDEVTEHPRKNGKVYMCSPEGAFSDRIVGYSIGDRMSSELAQLLATLEYEMAHEVVDKELLVA